MAIHQPIMSRAKFRINWERFSAKMLDDDIFDVSASLAFYTALSLAPILILLLTFLSFMGEGFRQELLLQIQELVGIEASKVTRAIAESVDQQPEIRDFAGIVGVSTLIFSAGVIFGSLRRSLNKIFEAPAAGDPVSTNIISGAWAFAKDKLFNMGMVLTFVFISIVSLLISSVISLSLKGAALALGQLINLFVSFLIFWLLFSAIFWFLPQMKTRRRVAILSGFITAILFSLGKALIGVYLGQSAVASMYGAAGSLILLLLWVYYSSIVIYFGAELSYEINREVVHEKNLE